MNRDARIDHVRFGLAQLICVGGLVAGGAIAYIVRDLTGHDSLFGLIAMFDVGNENGLATFFSALNLLLAGGLTFLLAWAPPRDDRSRRWTWLAWVFVYLAFDEATMIHENFDRLSALLPAHGFIQARHAWLLFGLPFAAVAAAVFLPLLADLPRFTAAMVLLAGAMFAAGSLGFELLGSWMIGRGIGPDTLLYDMRRVAEEGLEMAGIALYNWAVVCELGARRTSVTVRIDPVISAAPAASRAAPSGIAAHRKPV